jgi:hypothetical protein
MNTKERLVRLTLTASLAGVGFVGCVGEDDERSNSSEDREGVVHALELSSCERDVLEVVRRIEDESLFDEVSLEVEVSGRKPLVLGHMNGVWTESVGLEGMFGLIIPDIGGRVGQYCSGENLLGVNLAAYSVFDEGGQEKVVDTFRKIVREWEKYGGDENDGRYSEMINREGMSYAYCNLDFEGEKCGVVYVSKVDSGGKVVVVLYDRKEGISVLYGAQGEESLVAKIYDFPKDLDNAMGKYGDAFEIISGRSATGELGAQGVGELIF